MQQGRKNFKVDKPWMKLIQEELSKREGVEVSSREMARRMGMKVQSLHRYITGDYEAPLWRLIDVVETLGIPLERAFKLLKQAYTKATLNDLRSQYAPPNKLSNRPRGRPKKKG